jgi:hypothetical protein
MHLQDVVPVLSFYDELESQHALLLRCSIPPPFFPVYPISMHMSLSVPLWYDGTPSQVLAILSCISTVKEGKDRALVMRAGSLRYSQSTSVLHAS